MSTRNKTLVEVLVAVAWADGRLVAEEKEMLDAVIAGLHLTNEEADEIRRWAETPRSLDDAPIDMLSAEERRRVFGHAVVLSTIDGQQSDEELEFLRHLASRFGLAEQDSQRIWAESEARARKLLELL